MTSQHLLDAALNETQFDLADDYVVYPDAGAQKRYAKAFDGNVLVGQSIVISKLVTLQSLI
jgi:hypothetical protein